MKNQKKLDRYLTKPDKIARSFKGGRYAMAALLCVDFSEAMGAMAVAPTAGGRASVRNWVRRSS